MTTQRARTYSEAYLYLRDLVGEGIDVPAHTTLKDGPGDAAILVFDATHGGRHHHVEFEVPMEPADAPSGAVYGFGPLPSTLLDAGQWRGYSVTYAAGATVALERLGTARPDEALLTEIVDTLDHAAAMLDEVAKFLPPGAAEVPATAFWTPEGNAARARFPGYFTRERIEADRTALRQRIEEVIDRYWRDRG